jgi:hypothetical protein
MEFRAVTKYEALHQALSGSSGPTSEMTFAQIDKLVGGLPTSARKHREWWANSRTHSHALAWLNAGWKVQRVDLNTARVQFVHGGGKRT